MTAPRYSRLRVGLLEDLPTNVSRGTSATELLARILLSPIRRTIPGLLRCGESTLAEELGWPLPTVKKRVRELEAAGVLLFDRGTRDLLVLGAIEVDGPTTGQSTKAMARQARELKPSKVRDEVYRAITAGIDDGKHDALMVIWRAESTLKSESDSKPESRADSSVLPLPSIPISESPENPQPLPKDPRRHLAAVGRIGMPSLQAAAEALERPEALALAEINLNDWGRVCEAYQCSFFLSDRGRKPPTLQRLIEDESMRKRFTKGDFQDGTKTWRCAQCGTDHRAIDDCPPRCRGCDRNHGPDQYCPGLRALEAWERTQLETDATSARTGLAPAAALSG